MKVQIIGAVQAALFLVTCQAVAAAGVEKWTGPGAAFS